MKLESKPMFPIIAGQQVYGDGLSIRDYTAIMAMQGDLSTQSDDYGFYVGPEDYSRLAEKSYKIAGAMMKEGSK